METVLNVGLCSATIPGLIEEDGQRAVRLRRLSPLDHDVFRRGDGEGRRHRAGRGQGHPRATREDHGQAEEVEGLQVRHRPDGRRPEEALRRVQGEGQGSPRASEFPDEPMEQLWGAIGAVFKSWNGRRAVLLPQDRGHSATSGAPPATCRAWSSATWATARPPAWPSAATRPPARTSSTASGWSTPRAKTWWPASARPTR